MFELFKNSLVIEPYSIPGEQVNILSPDVPNFSICYHELRPEDIYLKVADRAYLLEHDLGLVSLKTTYIDPVRVSVTHCNNKCIKPSLPSSIEKIEDGVFFSLKENGDFCIEQCVFKIKDDFYVVSGLHMTNFGIKKISDPHVLSDLRRSKYQVDHILPYKIRLS